MIKPNKVILILIINTHTWQSSAEYL